MNQFSILFKQFSLNIMKIHLSIIAERTVSVCAYVCFHLDLLQANEVPDIKFTGMIHIISHRISN